MYEIDLHRYSLLQCIYTSYIQVVQNMLLFIEQLLHCFITFKGGSLGGRTDERTGEAEGDHRRT